MTKVSIAIPTWENNGRGVEFLDDLIRTIEIQTLTDYEVIVSDHSENNDIKNVVKHYERKGMNIKHVRNTENRGNGPANTNAAIDLCTGEIVKIMFQDDLFTDDAALEVRNKIITRDEAKSLVKRFDGEFPKKYFKDIMKYLKMNDGDFLKLLDKFRSPHLWKKVQNKWKLRHTVGGQGVDD